MMVVALAQASLSPATTSRFLPRSALRLLNLTASVTDSSPPSSSHHARYFPVTAIDQVSNWRPHLKCFCSTTTTSIREIGGDNETKVREFRRRTKIADVKGGVDEGLDRPGERIVVRGWVRTCRVQSSVSFDEVNDGSCVSNIQCVMSSDAEGYDTVESGSVTTGASVLIEGIVVKSQGSKQKIEVKVDKLVLVGKSDPASFPIQKKRVSREFLRSIAHLRPRTNTFGCSSKECTGLCNSQVFSGKWICLGFKPNHHCFRL